MAFFDEALAFSWFLDDEWESKLFGLQECLRAEAGSDGAWDDEFWSVAHMK